jgi:hypothetical protein
LINLSWHHMLLWKDIRSIRLIHPYYNLSLTPYIGIKKRQYICYVLSTLAISA